MRKTHWSVWFIFIPAVLLFVHLTSKPEEEARKKAQRELMVQPPPNDGKMYRGYDHKSGHYIEDKSYNYHYRPHTYSDKELQELREELEYDTEGRYFHIPGKRVLTREQEIQEEIDRYVEDNIDDIIDEYGK